MDSKADLTYRNIMQLLVEEKAEQYIKRFGLCSCKQCTTEVMARACNNLPPMYVVMQKGEEATRLAMYEPVYSGTVIAQLTRTCQELKENPIHD